MLNHDKIINRLTIEQRISLVFSAQKLKREPIAEFDFHTISVDCNPFSGRNGYFTYFPQYKALASTWNTNIIQLAGKYSAIENNSLSGAKIFDLNFDSKISSASEDCFFNGKFISAFNNGVKDGGGIACVRFNCEDSENFHNKMSAFNNFIGDKPAVILIDTLEEIKFLKERHNYKKTLFGNSTTKENAVSLIQNGVSLVFTAEEIHSETCEHALKSVNTYNKALVDLNNGSINEAQFNAICESGNALSEQMLNRACNEVIEILCKLDGTSGENVLEPLMKFYPKEHKVSFDEILHNDFSYEAAKQSVILLKNEGVLPLNYKKKVAVIGDYVKNDIYIKDFAERFEIYKDLVFDCINDYEELNTVGYVHGYVKDLPQEDELIRKARKLAFSSDVVLVFLTAPKGEKALPENQLELLRQLKTTDKPIIGIVVSNNILDFSFSDLCSALIFSYNGGQGVNRAILDVITGRISPSGKMIETSFDEDLDYIPNYTVNESKYPFGFGLTYAQFEYSNFEVSNAGASVTIENKSNIDAFETVQLYVSKPDSKYGLVNKQLKGFAKVFVEAGCKQKVYIPFDDNTFTVYNNNLACYMIEGGKYVISLGNSYKDEKFISTLKLKKYLNKTLFKNRVIENGDQKQIDNQIGKIADSAEKQKIIKKNIFLTAANKIALAIFFLIYANVFSGLMIFSQYGNMSSSKFEIFTIIVSSIDAVISLFCLILIFVLISKRKKVKYIPANLVNDTLTQVIDNVGLFHQDSKITYVEDVIEEEIEEIKEESVQEEQIDVEEESDNLLNLDTQSQTEENYSYLNLNDVFNKYSIFIRSRRLAIEPFAMRSVFSSLLSTNFIFIKSSNKENLKKFIVATQEFFSSEKELFEINDRMSTVKDLLVNSYGDKKEISSFAKNLNNACLGDKLTILAINGVSVLKVGSLLAEFIKFNENPSITRFVNLNDTSSIKLKSNVKLMVIPEEDNFTEMLPEFLAKSVVCLNINVRDLDEEVNYEGDFVSLSWADVCDQLDDVRNSCFISEDNWKNIDKLEELLYEKEGVSFGNKITIFSEKFSSIFIDCNGEDYEAVDAIIAFKYLPIIKGLELYKKVGGDQEVSDLLDKVFGKDNLDRTSRLVKKIVIQQNIEQIEKHDDAEILNTTDNQSIANEEVTNLSSKDDVENLENVEILSKENQEENVSYNQDKSAEENKDNK